jgi:hypothetical protein
LTLADVHAKLGARLHGVVADSLQHADMKKCIARTVAELDETEAFLGTEELYGRIDRRPFGLWRRPLWSVGPLRTIGRRASRRGFVRRKIVIKPAALRPARISFALH